MSYRFSRTDATHQSKVLLCFANRVELCQTVSIKRHCWSSVLFRIKGDREREHPRPDPGPFAPALARRNPKLKSRDGEQGKQESSSSRSRVTISLTRSILHARAAPSDSLFPSQEGPHSIQSWCIPSHWSLILASTAAYLWPGPTCESYSFWDLLMSFAQLCLFRNRM
jgi:hypothetical protein